MHRVLDRSGCSRCEGAHTGKWQLRKKHYAHCEKRFPEEGVQCNRAFAVGVGDTQVSGSVEVVVMSDSTLILSGEDVSEKLSTDRRLVRCQGGAVLKDLTRNLELQLSQKVSCIVVVAMCNELLVGGGKICSRDEWRSRRDSVIQADIPRLAVTLRKFAERSLVVCGADAKVWTRFARFHLDPDMAPRYDEMAQEYRAAMQSHGLCVVDGISELSQIALGKDGMHFESGTETISKLLNSLDIWASAAQPLTEPQGLKGADLDEVCFSCGVSTAGRGPNAWVGSTNCDLCNIAASSSAAAPPMEEEAPSAEALPTAPPAQPTHPAAPPAPAPPPQAVPPRAPHVGAEGRSAAAPPAAPPAHTVPPAPAAPLPLAAPPAALPAPAAAAQEAPPGQAAPPVQAAPPAQVAPSTSGPHRQTCMHACEEQSIRRSCVAVTHSIAQGCATPCGNMVPRPL